MYKLHNTKRFLSQHKWQSLSDRNLNQVSQKNIYYLPDIHVIVDLELLKKRSKDRFWFLDL